MKGNLNILARLECGVVPVSILLLIHLCIGTAIAQDRTAQENAKAQETEARSLAMPLKVMSFNIRYGTASDGENQWKFRADLVRETIRMFDPDILGAQEVLEFQADFLQEALSDYGFHGVGRDDGKARGEFVPVMYKKERFEVVEAGHFWLSETPDEVGSRSWDSSLPRMVSWLQLKDRFNDGAPLVVLNTHFDHRGQQARLESARLIRKRAQPWLDNSIPLVVTGDFNTTEDGEPYAQLVGNHSEEAGLLDAHRQAHPNRSNQESTFSAWNGRRQGQRIDWILHSRRFVTLQAIINHTNDGGQYPSDHYPVQAILRLKKAN